MIDPTQESWLLLKLLSGYFVVVLAKVEGRKAARIKKRESAAVGKGEPFVFCSSPSWEEKGASNSWGRV